MRILYQLTSPMEKTALGPSEVKRRREFLRARAAPGVDVDVWSLAAGPASIESAYEAALVVPELTRLVVRAQEEGFAATIVGCFSDPGLDALRELVDIPVIGPGASAVHLAAQLGTRFSIIAPFGGGDGRVAARLRALGVADKFASVRGIGMSVLDLARDREAVLERVTEVARTAARDDGADVFVLGCMSMGFVGVADDVQKRLGLPVVNPVVAALWSAQAVVAMGLSPSKAAYPVPPKLEVTR
ncbi:MAG TPA: aspartate/glutamate racemase family protein [Candidatus Methylomirabilis sp.]|nr:aspartate/glutamate racemase family protein [Candidatus Methylomirabilis sp.]